MTVAQGFAVSLFQAETRVMPNGVNQDAENLLPIGQVQRDRHFSGILA